MQKHTTLFDDLKKAYDPSRTLGRLDIHSYSSNDYGNISNDARELIINADDNVTLFINSPLSKFLIFNSDKVIRAVSEVSDLVKVRILLKRSRGSEEVNDLIERLHYTGYRKGNDKIEILDKEVIEDQRLRDDYFIVADRRNVFWKKSIHKVSQFIYDVPWIGENLESQVRLLEAKHKDNIRYKDIPGIGL